MDVFFFSQAHSSIVPEPQLVVSAYALRVFSPRRFVSHASLTRILCSIWSTRQNILMQPTTRTSYACHRHTNLRGGKASPLRHRLFSSAGVQGVVTRATRRRRHAKAKRHQSSTGCLALHGSSFSPDGDRTYCACRRMLLSNPGRLRQMSLSFDSSVVDFPMDWQGPARASLRCLEVGCWRTTAVEEEQQQSRSSSSSEAEQSRAKQSGSSSSNNSSSRAASEQQQQLCSSDSTAAATATAAD